MNEVLIGIIIIAILYAVDKGKITLPAALQNIVAPAAAATNSAVVAAESSLSNLSAAEATFSTPINVSGSGSGAKVGIGGTGTGGSAVDTDTLILQGVSSGMGIAASLLATSATTGPAAPFVAAGAGLVALFSKIFTGANPLEEDASKVEQCYEAAANNLGAIFKRTQMITKAEALSAMQALISAGQNMETVLAQKGIGQPAINGARNIEVSITDSMQGLAGTPEIATPATINVATARQYYVGGSLGQSSKGWYADSLATAATLTDNFLYALGGG